ncbi:MAG TPA: DNA-processing protein DprA [Armatimonadota bacterium]
MALGHILQHTGGDVPAGVFGRAASWYAEEYGLPRAAAKALSEYVPQGRDAYAKLPIRLVTTVDQAYPGDLRRMEHPPPLVSEHGIGNCELTKGSFSVLCSARSEMDRAEEAKAAIQAGLEAGWHVVSGHNRPIYQWAVLAAKRSERPSVMVLDRGFLCAFDSDMHRDPVAAARIWGFAFDADHCTALSAFRLRDAWTPPNGRRRDAMVVALSDTIVVLGMRSGGTIHHLCEHALASGQRVYADEAAMEVLGSQGASLWTGTFPAGPLLR